MATIRQARPEDAAAIAQVIVTSWRSTYRGIVSDDFLNAMSVDAPAALLQAALAGERGIWVIDVAESNHGEVVGFSGARESEEPGYDAELRMLYILDAYQRQGLGRALMNATVSRLADLRMTSLMLWVFAGNPAAGFYERLGGRLLREDRITVMGLSLDAVAYGWPDTSAFRPLPKSSSLD